MNTGERAHYRAARESFLGAVHSSSAMELSPVKEVRRRAVHLQALPPRLVALRRPALTSCAADSARPQAPAVTALGGDSFASSDTLLSSVAFLRNTLAGGRGFGRCGGTRSGSGRRTSVPGRPSLRVGRK